MSISTALCRTAVSVRLVFRGGIKNASRGTYRYEDSCVVTALVKLEYLTRRTEDHDLYNLA